MTLITLGPAVTCGVDGLHLSFPSDIARAPELLTVSPLLVTSYD